MSLYAKHTNLQINAICFQISISIMCYCLLLNEILTNLELASSEATEPNTVYV